MKKAKDRKADRHKDNMLECTECDKVFKRKWTLKEHLKNVHGITDLKTYHSFNDVQKKEELKIVKTGKKE